MDTAGLNWLLAIGDSLTWGSDITKPRASLPEDRDNAWPAHLGKLLNVPNIINRGWPGRSNDSIFRNAIQDMTRFSKILGSGGVVVIGWSAPMRWEMYNPYQLSIDLTKGGNYPGQEGQHLFVNVADFLEGGKLEKELGDLKEYFLHFRTWENHEIELWLDWVLSTTAVAKSLGLKILHFNAVDEIQFIKLDHLSKHLTDSIGKEYFKPYDRDWAMWQHYAYVERSNEGKLKESPLHPNAEQHKDWAKVLFDYLNEIY